MTASDFITTAEVAKLLKISASTVQRMAREGRVTALKVGKLWRFPAQSPHILLYKQDQLRRRKERAESKESASRNGLREFVKLACDLGFLEPLDRGKLSGGGR